jgi:FkbM family methyltransferase
VVLGFCSGRQPNAVIWPWKFGHEAISRSKKYNKVLNR